MLDRKDLLWHTHSSCAGMPFVLDVRSSLSANVIQRLLMESGRVSLFDSFDKILGDAARLSSQKTLSCPPERWASQSIGPDILKTTVGLIMTCLAGTIQHSPLNAPENIIVSVHNGLRCRDSKGFTHAFHCKIRVEIEQRIPTIEMRGIT